MFSFLQWYLSLEIGYSRVKAEPGPLVAPRTHYSPTLVPILQPEYAHVEVETQIHCFRRNALTNRGRVEGRADRSRPRHKPWECPVTPAIITGGGKPHCCLHSRRDHEPAFRRAVTLLDFILGCVRISECPPRHTCRGIVVRAGGSG